MMTTDGACVIALFILIVEQGIAKYDRISLYHHTTLNLVYNDGTLDLVYYDGIKKFLAQC
jgi:hypothetical protein